MVQNEGLPVIAPHRVILQELELDRAFRAVTEFEALAWSTSETATRKLHFEHGNEVRSSCHEEMVDSKETSSKGKRITVRLMIVRF